MVLRAPNGVRWISIELTLSRMGDKLTFVILLGP
jgi:hypothetical protein